MEWLWDQLIQTFVTDNRWRYFARGIGVTLEVTVLALVLGTIIGVLVAVVRSAHDSQQGNKGVWAMCCWGFWTGCASCTSPLYGAPPPQCSF